jgi:hypothetical protein
MFWLCVPARGTQWTPQPGISCGWGRAERLVKRSHDEPPACRISIIIDKAVAMVVFFAHSAR